MVLSGKGLLRAVCAAFIFASMLNRSNYLLSRRRLLFFSATAAEKTQGQGQPMRVTIKDIAAHAGVSKSLVSLYLNSHPASRMKSETRDKIDRAVKALNYRPSIMARSFRHGRSRTVGLVIGHITGHFAGFYIQMLQQELNWRGYQLLPAIIPRFDRGEELRCLENLIDRHVDGILYDLLLADSPEIVKLLKNVPILMSKPHSVFNTSVADSAAPLDEACRRLRAMGCRTVLGSSFWEKPIRHACEGNGLEAVMEDSFNREADFFDLALSGDVDALIMDDGIAPKKIIHYGRMRGLATLPPIVYSYSLPEDFIDHPAILGAVAHPFREIVQGRIERIVEMIEQPGGEVEHRLIKTFFMDRDALREHFREQSVDPFYDDKWRYSTPLIAPEGL